MLLNCVGGLSLVLYLYFLARKAGSLRQFWVLPQFRAVLVCAFTLGIAVVAVNTLAPEKKVKSVVIAADTLSAAEADTTAINLLRQNSRFHYQLLQKLNTFDKYKPFHKSVKGHYAEFITSDDQNIRNRGFFGLAVLASLNDEHQTADRFLSQIPDAAYPFVNFLQAEMMLEEGLYAEAEIAFKKELHVAGGNFTDSYLRLVDLYEGKQDYEALGELLRVSAGEHLVPGHLARKAFLFHHDITGYLSRLTASINEPITSAGLIAALAIFMVWFTYVVLLDRYQGFRVTDLLCLALCGGLTVFAIIAFNDGFDFISPWARNGDFLNDLIYCVTMVGLPEEIVKFLPIGVLLIAGSWIKTPLDYIRYSAAIALGFAFIENLIYFKEFTGGIIHGRAFLAAVGHMADAGILAYGFIYNRFFNKGKYPKSLVLITFLAASVVSHGVYDFLLYHNFVLAFFVFFIAVVVAWARIINLCVNASCQLTTSRIARLAAGENYLLVALTFIFVAEYLLNGFVDSRDHANRLLMSNGVAFFYIVFFAKLLFNFRSVDLVGNSAECRQPVAAVSAM
jgi:RsiW-degrading membrane proteinase PrsW (M82 family)